MGQPILDPTLRIGRFFLADVLRSFEGAGQWFLRNIAYTTRMSEPLLGEIMGNLMRVKAARFVFDRNRGDVFYEQGRPHPILSCKYVRDRLTRQEADRLIEAVCDRAAKLNKDAAASLYLRNHLPLRLVPEEKRSPWGCGHRSRN